MKALAALFLALGGLAHAAPTLSTADTVARIEVHDAHVRLASLHDRHGGPELVSSPVDIPWVSTAQSDGHEIALDWRLVSVQSTPTRVVVTLACPQLQLQSVWRAVPGPGPIEHSISITNRTSNEIVLPLQTSLRIACRGDEQWWVEKSAGGATDVGVHRVPLTRGVHTEIHSTPYADGEPREAVPWTSVQGQDGGWYAGIESSARVHMAWSDGQFEAGLQPEPGYGTRLAPGETFDAPTVFVGCYHGDVDDGANRLRRWCEAHLRPTVQDPSYPWLTNNSWGSGMAVDAALSRTMIDESAELGLDMFHVDAGWFNGVGDWRADAAKFPDGLADIADYAHQRGLKFGLWVGWTQGGILPDAADPASILNVFQRRDWFTHDVASDWKPQDFVGSDLCLGDPAAVDWCSALLDRLIHDTHIDMLEHDQRMVVSACSRTDHQHTPSPTDISYRAAQGYYRVYDGVLRRHPGLLLENCVNGGRMVDYGAMRRAHYFSISDAYDPLSNRRAFYDNAYALPPSMCECYVQQVPVKSIPEFVAMLRSGMMGWCTIMCDTTRWTSEEHAAARQQFELYRTVLRPLIQHANLFHVSPRPDGIHWDGIEYSDTQTAVLLAFRGTADEPQHTFLLRGLDPHATYSNGRTGQDLMQHGLTVQLNAMGTSEIVVLRVQP